MLYYWNGNLKGLFPTFQEHLCWSNGVVRVRDYHNYLDQHDSNGPIPIVKEELVHESQRLINHVALVLDASASMAQHTKTLIAVADEQIKYLAIRSEELQQETRVSVYTFDWTVKCLIFDMDVMRLPSIADLYSTNGMTALVDATIKSQDDLKTTSQIYGDHAFLTFILTDGGENASKNSWRLLPKYTSGKPNWTVGFLVPDTSGVTWLTRAGVNRDSIAIWDATSAKGVVDSFSTIRNATDKFMTNRASGIHGSSGVFSTGVDAVNAITVKALTPLKGFKVFDVTHEGRIDDFVEAAIGHYTVGSAYYELTKTETIQPKKNILVVSRKNGQVYGGPEARNLIGLQDTYVDVKPDENPLYRIFVQSTSRNRKLKAKTKVMVKV